jgi:membrane-associated phospholipid phosphatase
MTDRYALRLRRPRFTGRATPLVTRGQSIRRLLVLAGLSGAVAAIAWYGTTQTLVGQQLADVILYGRFTADPDVIRAANEALAVVGLTSAAIAALGLLTIALAHGGIGLALAGLAVLVGANLTSFALKANLDRPDLLGNLAYAFGNSFPSGTVTLAASIGFVAVLVVPRRIRTPTAVLAAAGVAVVGASTIVAGWHRLADVVGAMLISLAWASIVAAVLALAQGWMPRRTWGRGVGGRVVGIVAVVGIAAVAGGALGIVILFAEEQRLVEAIGGRSSMAGPFIAALAIAVGTALVAFAAYVRAMRGIALELPG